MGEGRREQFGERGTTDQMGMDEWPRLIPVIQIIDKVKGAQA
jgi:hypothetical protein